MADRPASFAKSVEGLHHEESALDRARALRDQFAHAQGHTNEKQREAEKPQGEGEKSGSPMIRDDKPPMRPTPSGPMRQGPDRYADGAKMGKEYDNANAKLEAARKAQEAFKARQGHSPDHERDRDR